jgi:septum formation protein
MIILASQSPRRKELFATICHDFAIIPSNKPEIVKEGTDYFEVPKVLATAKALDVFSTHQDDVVIGCDTVVITPFGIFGKPKDFIEANYMLNCLNDTEHFVVTGICILSKKAQIIYSEVSKVTFNKLTSKEIYDYLLAINPFDKAGAYAIQDQPIQIIKSFTGEESNIMGLPTIRLKEELIKLQVLKD